MIHRAAFAFGIPPSSLELPRTNPPADIDTIERVKGVLREEIPSALEFARSCRETVAFFGGARVKEDDPLYREGLRWGQAVTLMNLAGIAGKDALERVAAGGMFEPQLCAAALGAVVGAEVGMRGINAINRRLLLANATTGAGPGIMGAVPQGVRIARKKLESAFPEYKRLLRVVTRTQGSRIELEFEQATSSEIELLERFSHFLARRLALTEHSAGFVIFPGGFGTMNELLEVMRGDRPLVFQSNEFWREPLNAIFDAWKQRGFVEESKLSRYMIADGPEQGLPHLVSYMAEKKPLEPTIEKGFQMAADAEAALTTLATLPAAVTFIGSRRLRASDREVGVARRLAKELRNSDIAVRVGGSGALLDAVSKGAKKKVQALLLDLEDAPIDRAAVAKKCEVAAIVHTAPVHKLVMYENTKAIVALPGGVGTFDEVFEVATLMQTGKIQKRPLILVGREFWAPILEKIRATMEPRGLIGKEDMNLFQVVDTEAEALAIIKSA